MYQDQCAYQNKSKESTALKEIVSKLFQSSTNGVMDPINSLTTLKRMSLGFLVSNAFKPLLNHN
jgi:hypothetical protein